MKPLNEIFEVAYGNKFDLNKLAPSLREHGGVNFVGRSSQNHGVSGIVAPVEGIEPYSAGWITVALGGSKLLSSFVQEAPFYTAQNVAVLRPLKSMTFQQKLYVCLAIRHNRFRYSAFGREANRTLKTLLIPDLNEFPSWISELECDSIEKFESSIFHAPVLPINTDCWRPFVLGEIFDVQKGKRLTKAAMISGKTPFIGSTDSNNGVTATVGQSPIHEGNTISLSYNGSVAEAFYQPVPFWATDDVNVLYPKFTMSPEIALFICTVIRMEKYRYNYGRKWHLERMRESLIKLPVTSQGQPDFAWMEQYIKRLPYSSQIRKAPHETSA
jgi:hypothetical protein